MNRKLYYIFHSGKNFKLGYYLKAYCRLLVPRFICRNELSELLSELEERPDRDYIQERVDYYCKLSTPVELPASCGTLRQAWKKVCGGTVYDHDTYEFTRYFSPEKRWAFLPGDIVTVPDQPSVVKSRPLCDGNDNSVLLKLDKIRHFIFVEDDIPFEEKTYKVLFRGKVKGKEPRKAFMQAYYGNPLFDVGDVGRRTDSPMEWRKEKLTIREHLDYKFIMAIEGNDVASNLKWVMSSNSLAVMPRPTCETWFMEGKLIPNYHYVEVKPDFSDVEERTRYYNDHPEEAKAIIAHAHEYVAQFKDQKREKLISLAVLDKYFQMVH
ncbi:MAG: lipopolysaccharide biosynthesis protein [Paludibacteraceae bacterium]|nr:lipopolysaccharide biosynthesis protein [Paludibacteraceae bacterium]